MQSIKCNKHFILKGREMMFENKFEFQATVQIKSNMNP